MQHEESGDGALGADHVIDRAREDFTRNAQQYDLFLAVNGYHPISDYLCALVPEGAYFVAGGSMFQLIQAASNKNRIYNSGERSRTTNSDKVLPLFESVAYVL